MTVIMHKVKDFNQWKRAFDSVYALRKKYGEKGYSIGTFQGEPNNVFLIHEWETYEQFKKFKETAELKKAVEDAGVIGEPTILFVDEVKKE